MVFDKGVESIQNSYYFYLIYLSDALVHLMKRIDQQLTIYKSIFDYLNLKYNFLSKRLSVELELALKLICQMYYNDLKYTKIASHLMFLQKLAAYANDQNLTQLNAAVLSKLDTNKHLLNSFLQQKFEK